MKKELIGKVVSDKMEKSAVVEVERFKMHPLYKKRFRRTKKYTVHDEIGVKVGDLVKIRETRPISKTKRFKIVEVIKNGAA